MMDIPADVTDQHGLHSRSGPRRPTAALLAPSGSRLVSVSLSLIWSFIPSLSPTLVALVFSGGGGDIRVVVPVDASQNRARALSSSPPVALQASAKQCPTHILQSCASTQCTPVSTYTPKKLTRPLASRHPSLRHRHIRIQCSTVYHVATHDHSSYYC
jgi:hypothetical protein